MGAHFAPIVVEVSAVAFVFVFAQASQRSEAIIKRDGPCYPCAIHMAGFVLDLYIGFLIRWVILAWRDALSYKWPAVSATVISCHFERAGFGGDFVVLRYK